MAQKAYTVYFDEDEVPGVEAQIAKVRAGNAGYFRKLHTDRMLQVEAGQTKDAMLVRLLGISQLQLYLLWSLVNKDVVEVKAEDVQRLNDTLTELMGG